MLSYSDKKFVDFKSSTNKTPQLLYFLFSANSSYTKKSI